MSSGRGKGKERAIDDFDAPMSHWIPKETLDSLGHRSLNMNYSIGACDQHPTSQQTARSVSLGIVDNSSAGPSYSSYCMLPVEAETGGIPYGSTVPNAKEPCQACLQGTSFQDVMDSAPRQIVTSVPSESTTNKVKKHFIAKADTQNDSRLDVEGADATNMDEDEYTICDKALSPDLAGHITSNCVVRRGELDRLRGIVISRLYLLKQNHIKEIAANIINVMVPKKQSSYPYASGSARTQSGGSNNLRIPMWWPQDMYYQSPHRMKWPDRMILIEHMVLMPLIDQKTKSEMCIGVLCGDAEPFKRYNTWYELLISALSQVNLEDKTKSDGGADQLLRHKMRLKHALDIFRIVDEMDRSMRGEADPMGQIEIPAVDPEIVRDAERHCKVEINHSTHPKPIHGIGQPSNDFDPRFRHHKFTTTELHTKQSSSSTSGMRSRAEQVSVNGQDIHNVSYRRSDCMFGQDGLKNRDEKLWYIHTFPQGNPQVVIAETTLPSTILNVSMQDVDETFTGLELPEQSRAVYNRWPGSQPNPIMHNHQHVHGLQVEYGTSGTLVDRTQVFTAPSQSRLTQSCNHPWAAQNANILASSSNSRDWNSVATTAPTATAWPFPAVIHSHPHRYSQSRHLPASSVSELGGEEEPEEQGHPFTNSRGA